MKIMYRPENSLPHHIRAAFRGYETFLARYLVDWDLPLSQFYILRLAWTDKGRTQADIAKTACMTESVASQVIQKMEKAGLVKRETDRQDARKRSVFLTPKGDALRHRLLKAGISLAAEHTPNISREDMLTTLSVLSDVIKAFNTYNEDEETYTYTTEA